MEEFENRIANQVEVKKTSSKDTNFLHEKVLQKQNSGDSKLKIEDRNTAQPKKEQCFPNKFVSDEELKRRSMKQLMIIDGQHRDIKELKQTLSTTKAGMQFMQMKFHDEMQNLGLHIHGLAHAASEYHKVLLENRKLYNQVQDLKGEYFSLSLIDKFDRVVDMLVEGDGMVTSFDENVIENVGSPEPGFLSPFGVW
ncbi:hypothetical protein AgCh_029729 [Apium graveolens]